MMTASLLSDIQGLYDIAYTSTPQLPDWFELGYGSAKVDGTNLTGVDGHGVIWNGSFEVLADGTLQYQAILDPKDAAPNAGLMDKTGKMTRVPQSYSGILKVTKSAAGLILRTRVQQGPLLIDVQFIKK